eukprot:13174_1
MSIIKGRCCLCCELLLLLVLSLVIDGSYSIDIDLIGVANKISEHPSTTPSSEPTPQPSLSPTKSPSVSPTQTPSFYPTITPTLSPSIEPSSIPTIEISYNPTIAPSLRPSVTSSYDPTISPSSHPTNQQSSLPSNHEDPLSAFTTQNAKNKGDGPNSISGSGLITIIASIGGLVLCVAALMTRRRLKRRRMDEFKLTNIQQRYNPNSSQPISLDLEANVLAPIPKQISMALDEFEDNTSRNDEDKSEDKFYDNASQTGWDPSTIATERSGWRRKIDLDKSYEGGSCDSLFGEQTRKDLSFEEDKSVAISEFILPSIFDPSTIKSEGTFAQRLGVTKSHEGLHFFTDEPIPDQIFCVDDK